MSINSLGISGSGMTAERARLDAISRNIANAQTTRGVDGRAYRRQMVMFETLPSDSSGKGGGVRALDPIEQEEGMVRVYNPSHPHHDAEGYVELPNVNIVEEMVDMIAATRAYEANVGAANATKTMISRAIDLGRL